MHTKLSLSLRVLLVPLICLVVSAVHGAGIESLKTGLRFQTLPYASKLSNIVTNDIIQDRSGFIWIATNDGLNRYDGNSNTVYRPSTKNVASISHFYIADLYIDHLGVLWVGTEEGLNQYDEYRDEFHTFDKLAKTSSLSPLDAITEIFEDSNHRLWIGTRRNGLSLINKDRTSAISIAIPKKEKPSRFIKQVIQLSSGEILVLTKTDIYEFMESTQTLRLVDIGKSKSNFEIKKFNAILELNDGQILVGTKAGLFVLDYGLNHLTRHPSSTLHTQDFIELFRLSQSQLLLGTRNSGLYELNIDNNKTIQHVRETTEKYSLIDNQIYSIFVSNDSLIWIGTNLGINIINPRQKAFSHYKTKTDSNDCLSGNTIYTMINDKRNNIWIAAFGESLHKIGLDSGKCEKFELIENEQLESTLKNTVALHEDNNGIVWAGTFGEGLYWYSEEDGLFRSYSTFIKSNVRLKSNEVNAISSDKDNLWIATYGEGFYKLHTKKGTLEQFLFTSPSNDKNLVKTINDIHVDHLGNIWLATQDSGLIRFNPVTKHYAQFMRNSVFDLGMPKTLLSLDQFDNQYLWIGTRGYGAFRFDLSNNGATQYSVDNGLTSNAVMGTNYDQQNNIWIFTDLGLAKLNSQTNTITNYYEKDGLQSDAWTRASFLSDDKKYLWAAGINGFNRIAVTDIPEKSLTNTPQITGFELSYSPVTVKGNSPTEKLTSVIEKSKNINLSHDENVFSFELTGLEFEQPDNVKYAYMLEGYDHWNYVDSAKRYASYTNIDPGEYKLRVRTSYNNNWNKNEKSIAINIAAPWWNNPRAYVLYVIFITLIIVFTIRHRTRLLEERSRKLEKTVEERTNELATEKNKVEQLLSRKNEEFANVSHEFRTPLTLILGPLNQLLKKNQSDEDVNRLNIVQRNGYRLLRMVDQLLNLETFRVKAITQKSPQAIGKTIQLLAEAFYDLAKEKNIDLVIGRIDAVNFSFTPDAIEKITLNLLSNAIKYTSAGGKISISAIRSGDLLNIEVADTGIGIPEEKLQSVFERFNRVLDENSEQVTGAGIGLALVKSLVDAHQGTISITSELKKGTQLKVSLPIIGEVTDDQLCPHANQEIIAMELMSLTNQETLSELGEVDSTNVNQSNKPTLLVIEDNSDMRQYIVDSLTAEYDVLTAADGEQGLEVAKQNVPDLIISDVMMPKMDGYQTTKALRTDSITNHIPIILLTARGDRDSRIRGWREKADDYITKPFDVEELKIRVANLLEIRNILKKRFGESVFNADAENIIASTTTQEETNDQAEDIEKQALQQAFVNLLNEHLETIYTDSKASIAEIADSMAMSERQIFRKLKSILDMTPNEYLRRYRLEKAKELLLEGKAVNYAAIDVGFSSQGYFGKCFKAQYGVTPVQFVKSAAN